jgi:hypothetical protein
VENEQYEASFNFTGLNSPITEFALALTAVKDDFLLPSGTAIIIAPNIAITAKHVIENYIEIFHKKIPKADFNSNFSILAFQVLDNGGSGALWSVTKIALSDVTDIAYLYLSPSSNEAIEYSWRIPTLNLLPPKVGTKIHCFGYPKSEIVETNISMDEQDNNKKIDITWKDDPSTSTGIVIEIHERKRDSVMLNFPCFRTNARFDPGMSGGPVFNEAGELCGIISVGTEGIGDSYVALLWPSMITKLVDFPCFEEGSKYTIYDLIIRGYIKARNYQFISIEGNSVYLSNNSALEESND